MAVTTLDPVTALVVIDLQKGIVALPVADIPAVVANAVKLAEAFRRRSLPVVLVNVTGLAPGRTEAGPRAAGAFPDGWAELIPELGQQPADILITKRTWGAFMHTDLEARLRAAGVTQVAICGVSTSAGVESTARQAYELGFNVTVVADAVADMSAESHTASLTRIFPRLGETGDTDAVLTLLDAR